LRLLADAYASGSRPSERPLRTADGTVCGPSPHWQDVCNA